MFERLAKILFGGQRLNAPLSEAGRFYSIHSNDNRPGFRRPEGRRLRPQQALVCHWSFAADRRHLECAWEPAASERPADPWDLLSHLTDNLSVLAVDQMTAREQIAG